MKIGTKVRPLCTFGLLALPILFAVVASCGSTESNLASGDRCSLNSDCKAPLVCGFERCRAECRTSRDCGGKLCVRSAEGSQSGNVCQLDDEVECSHNSQCTGTQLCGPDRHCRDACITDKDCVTDLLCVSRVCAKPEELVSGKLPSSLASDAGASCVYATDCPGDLVCLYGRCDVECLGDKDCLVGWGCKPTATGGDGRCYPNAPSVDAAIDATGSDGAIVADASGEGGLDSGDASDGSGGLLAVNSVSAGSNHACAILIDGRVKCWGEGDYGQLGLGDALTRGDGVGEMGDALPYVNLGTGRTAQSLTAGSFHTCAILDNGRVKCWGSNNIGQLGLGDTLNRGTSPAHMGDALPYVDLGTGRTAKALASMNLHTCAILDNDRVKCWGNNGYGQLGLGDSSTRGDGPAEMGDALPYVDLGTGRTAKSVTVGFLSTCVLLDNDRVKCFGYAEYGQLGLGDQLHRGDAAGEMGDALPYVDLGTGRTVKFLTSGAYFTCALLDNNGLKCWGNGSQGELGLGNGVTRGDNPGEMGDALPYVDLGTGRSIKSLSCAGGHSCAILDNDRMKCWGFNLFGELGLGDTAYRGDNAGEMGDSLPYLDLGNGRSPKVAFAVSVWTCALLDNDGLKCWGRNNTGQLGLGDTAYRGDDAGEMGDALPFVKLVGP